VASRQRERPGACGLLLADPAAELGAAHRLVALEVELLLAQHRHVEPGLQHLELLALARGVACTRRRAHLLDPVRLAREQLPGPCQVGELGPGAPHLALHHEPAVGRDRLGRDRGLLHAAARQFARAAGRELLAHAQLEHGHVLGVKAEGVHGHVHGADTQLRVHELPLGDRALAHRQRLGGELPQHGVALDGEALGLGQRQRRALRRAGACEGEQQRRQRE
jgi:hypothetical protein